MDIYVDRKPENCNHCIFNQNASKYLDVEDYCILNKKNICMIIMDKDCPLEELEDNKASEKGIRGIIKNIKMIFKKGNCQNRKRTPDLIQMNTNISLTDKDGKFIEVKTPEPEYIDMIW